MFTSGIIAVAFIMMFASIFALTAINKLPAASRMHLERVTLSVHGEAASLV